MPMRLIAADDWRPSIMMERRLWDLVGEGLLCPATSSTRPEWIAPPVEHWVPSSLEGYVVSLVKFHRHELRSPPSRFMRALLHHYGAELQHLSPNAISNAVLGILNVITKSRLSFLILITVPKMPNLSLMPLKPSCHPQHDMRDAVLKYAIALLNE